MAHPDKQLQEHREGRVGSGWQQQKQLFSAAEVLQRVAVRAVPTAAVGLPGDGGKRGDSTKHESVLRANASLWLSVTYIN